MFEFGLDSVQHEYVGPERCEQVRALTHMHRNPNISSLLSVVDDHAAVAFALLLERLEFPRGH